MKLVILFILSISLNVLAKTQVEVPLVNENGILLNKVYPFVSEKVVFNMDNIQEQCSYVSQEIFSLSKSNILWFVSHPNRFDQIGYPLCYKGDVYEASYILKFLDDCVFSDQFIISDLTIKDHKIFLQNVSNDESDDYESSLIEECK